MEERANTMSEPDFEKMTPQEMAEYQRQNCIFCKIVKGEIPARKVFEDDKVLCILDIYPARKGHMLILPKEHYPVLPAIPKEVSVHMFRVAKGLSKAGKATVITDRSTIFIANGGIAGQQSPHFLFHIIPRETSDGLDNFNIIGKETPAAELEKILPALKQRIAAIVASSIQSQPPKMPQANAPKTDGSAEVNAEKFNYLAKMIHDNPQLKQLIIQDPVAFKREIDKIPDMKALFADVDVNVLANALSKIK